MSEYDIIAGMELLDIHIRGSDSKDNIIKNNRLIIFILMKGFVMSYVQGQNKEEGIPIKFVCLTDSVQFQKLNATTLILDKKVDDDSDVFTLLSINIKYGGYAIFDFYDNQF